MKPQKYYYKLCCPTDRIDTFDSIGTLNHSLDYKVGEKTVPKIENSGLFVFETDEQARKYKRKFSFDTLVLLKGYGTKRKHTPKYMCRLTYRAGEFWDLLKNKKTVSKHLRRKMEPGMVLLKSFTPTEIIE